MLGEATGKTELDWLVGGSSSRVLALPEGLSLGPSLPWFILLRENANLAPRQMLLPAPRTAPGPWEVLHTHFLWLLPAARKPPWAISPMLSFSAAFLGSVVYFQCLHLLASLSLFQSLRSGSPPPTPQGLPLSRSPWPLCP